MPIPWDDDPPGASRRIRNNLVDLLHDLVVSAPDRQPPTVNIAREWHQRIFDGVSLPVEYYAGEIRDSDPRYPELIGYDVQVGPYRGLPFAEVPEALERFESQVQRAVRLLDSEVPVGEVPRAPGVLGSVITLCAMTHGEWVRIHPFANGNGRTARLWANWSALRYGLPPFVRLRPRPEGDHYARAAADSMQGDHGATITLFADWLHYRIVAGNEI